MLFYMMLLDSEEERSFFENLYREHRQSMYGLAYGILVDTHAAEDAVHTVFLRLIKHLEKIERLEQEKQRSYLLTAVRRAALDIKRKQRRHAEIGLDEVPERLLINQETEVRDREIVNAIIHLPVIYREVLQYRYAIGLENKEISEVLRIPEATVRKRVERAKKILKERLESGRNGDD